MTLKCLPGFFYRPPAENSQAEPFFRSLRRVPKRERNRARSYAIVLSELAAVLDELVELPPVTLPPGLYLRTADDREIEHVALRVRAAWMIPPGPVANMVRLLEANGIIVAAVGDFDERLDAFSLRASDRPLTVLCSSKGIPKRRRFDAAHELGHLILHDSVRSLDATQERQAHRFAAALLMPAEEVEPWLPRRSNQLDLLQEASGTWGVSMQALLFRARVLGTLGESSYVRAMRRMSAMGWRSAEPVEAGPDETPIVLTAALDAYEASGMSVASLAERVGFPVGRVLRMLAVPEQRMAGQGGDVLQLRQPTAAS